MDGLISINGNVTNAAEATLSPLDRGLLFGDNVFEVCVALGNWVIDLKEHLERLRKSAAMIRLTIPWTDEELAFEIKTLVEALARPKSYVRLLVTRGQGMGLAIKKDLVPTKIVYCLPANREPEEVYKTGFKLAIKKSFDREAGPQAKTGNYLDSILALSEAQEAGYHDVLFTNSLDEITEATTANVFFIGRSGDAVEIATPVKTSGILLGITRGRIADLLRRSHIPVTERRISRDELPGFDEAFLTSTVRGLVPIQAIGAHKLYTTRDQAVFHHINRLFHTWLESEIGYRVDWNTGLPIS